MSSKEPAWRSLAAVRGWPEATATMREWRRQPLHTIGPWLLVAAAIALSLLALVWIVGVNVPADPAPPDRSLLEAPDDWHPLAMHLFRNNMLVLALHAAACLAGFIVHMALTEPIEGEHPRLAYWTRSLAIVAIAFVPVATLLSIGTQSWVLGARASSLSDFLRLPVSTILRTTLPHSLPELMAVFLPLAAWMVLQVRRRSGELLAATVVTVVIAVPVIYVAAIVETRGWPGRLAAERAAVATRSPMLEGVPLGEVVVDPTDLFSAEARLRAGPQLGGRDATFETFHEVIAAATRAAPRTFVVLKAGDVFVAHDLMAVREPHVCDRVSGVPREALPMTIDELAPLRLMPDSFGLSQLDERVFVFVQGARLFSKASLLPRDRSRATFRRRC